MKIKHVYYVLFILSFTIVSCGAPTPYQQYLYSKKSDCENECEKAHAEKDKKNRETCVKVCRAKKDLNDNPPKNEEEQNVF